MRPKLKGPKNSHTYCLRSNTPRIRGFEVQELRFMNNALTTGSNITPLVRQFILKEFPLARKRQINDSDPLIESGIVESLGVLQIVSFIEKTFSIQLLDDDLVPGNFHSIERIAALIAERR